MEKDSFQNDIAATSDVSQQELFVYLYTKTERIISALYLVTNLMSDSEPLKWQVRHRAVGLLGELLPLKDSKTTDRVRLRLLPAISEMLSLLDIGRRAELISDMNDTVVRHQLNQLGETLRERYDRGYLSETFFKRLEQGEESRHLALLKDTHESAIEDNEDSKGHKALRDVKDTKRQQLDTALKNSKKTGIVSSTHTEDATQRRARILRVLEKNRGKDVSIRDISREVSDCSEKTIQRDLTALIKEGRVRQHGARRWTRYTLVR